MTSRKPIAAVSEPANVPHQGCLWIADFNCRLQRGRVLENRPSNLVASDRLEAQLVPIGPAMRNGAVDRTRSHILQQIASQSVPDVDEPGQNFGPRASEDVLIQKDQFLRQNREDKSLRRMPISPDGLIVFNPQELAKLSIQTGLQRAQELQLDKINPARLVEAMRDFHPAGLAVEVSLVASREDHMVVSGLQLHPTPGCLAAIVSLSREQRTRGGSGLKPALDQFEPLEIIASRG